MHAGNLGLGGWGDRRAGALGTGVLAVICMVFKTLSENPLGKHDSALRNEAYH